LTVVLRAETDTDSIESVVAGLIRAWNAGDALAFASFFAEDADLVNIHGMHIRGRQHIAGIYEMLFRSVFSRSAVKGEISASRVLRKHVELAHIKVTFDTPAVPILGTQNALTSLVLVHDGPHWRVAALHNTLVSAT
jgi:uncharacterized protein (TIGR02246 family)